MYGFRFEEFAEELKVDTKLFFSAKLSIPIPERRMSSFQWSIKIVCQNFQNSMTTCLLWQRIEGIAPLSYMWFCHKVVIYIKQCHCYEAMRVQWVTFDESFRSLEVCSITRYGAIVVYLILSQCRTQCTAVSLFWMMTMRINEFPSMSMFSNSLGVFNDTKYTFNGNVEFKAISKCPETIHPGNNHNNSVLLHVKGCLDTIYLHAQIHDLWELLPLWCRIQYTTASERNFPPSSSFVSLREEWIPENAPLKCTTNGSDWDIVSWLYINFCSRPSEVGGGGRN